MDWLNQELARAMHEERLRQAAEHARYREARAFKREQRIKRSAALLEQLKMLRRRLRKLPA